VITVAVCRLINGVLEKPEATLFESFSERLPSSDLSLPQLEHGQYTRPEEFNGWKVPSVLLSGNHGEIKKWRGQK
jgi:tRNA (guanine37-N1)-methyltransferase